MSPVPDPSDPHAWPPHPHIAYLLGQLRQAREEVRAQFEATDRDQHPHTWRTLRDVAVGLCAIEDEARSHCGVSVAPAKPSVDATQPVARATQHPPRSPLDREWPWQAHEAQP